MKPCQFTVERVLIPTSPNSIQSKTQNVTHFDISYETQKQAHSPLSQNITLSPFIYFIYYKRKFDNNMHSNFIVKLPCFRVITFLNNYN